VRVFTIFAFIALIVASSRLVDGIRHQTNTNLLSKDWDISIQEKDSEFKDDLRGVSGIGRRKAVSRIDLMQQEDGRRLSRKKVVDGALHSHIKFVL
jgi:hypothetical protein